MALEEVVIFQSCGGVMEFPGYVWDTPRTRRKITTCQSLIHLSSVSILRLYPEIALVCWFTTAKGSQILNICCAVDVEILDNECP